MEFFNGAANGAGNVEKGLVCILPQGHRARVFGHGLQFGEGSLLPEAGPQDDGNHQRLTELVAFQCPRHFPVPAIVGRQKTGAHEKENDVRGVQVLVNPTLPVFSGDDLTVVPVGDHAAPSEHGQLLLELLPERLILVRIGVKKSQRFLLIRRTRHFILHYC